MNNKVDERSPQIFVMVPAYRDKELPSTLIDLISTASNPNRLRICVLWQHAGDEKLPSRWSKRTGVELIHVHHSESGGFGWARNVLQKQWRGEKYSLLIDSHHRFVPNWDRKAIGMIEELQGDGIEKPVLTAYLPSYDPGIDPEGRMQACRKTYFAGRDFGLLTRLTSYEITGWRWIKKPVPAQFVSLHFLFTLGIFNSEVIFDPKYYYTGDEVVTSLRAFTHGYDFYHPHRILGWHEYKRVDRISHWHDHPEWRKQDSDSLERLKLIFRGCQKGLYGVGTVRTVYEFENFLGIPLETIDRMELQ